MTKQYTEDQLVEKSAIDVFMKDLNYEFQDCFKEWETGVSPLKRENKSEVVLTERLSKAIDKLNNNVTEEAKKQVIEKITKDRSKLSLIKANQEVYKLIKDGVKVNIKHEGKQKTITVKIVDFENSKNNDFFLTSQFWIVGEVYTRRPDLIGFVNGIPMILIEFKAPNRPIKAAFDENITDYKDTIPQLFWYNSFILLSNGKEAKIGTTTSGYEHFNDWKRINQENEVGIISLDTMLKGVCEKNRFIDILENFTLFTTIEGNPVKIVAKNHQFLGVNNAVESFKKRKTNKGKLGVFWHTQGSGKSFSMIFFSQKVMRKFKGNYTFLVITDRKSLDKQIYQNFQSAGAVIEEEVKAKDGKHLKKLLKEDHRHVFTLINKFNTKKGDVYPELSKRDDIIIMADEAHRTQYDTLALNMRTALPNAAFLAFTGTPLLSKGEEKTKETFGKYVSTYNFRASIEDNATVPLFYENRVPELKIDNPSLNEDIYDIIDEADLDEKQEEKLSREFSTQYEIITREDRLDEIARDIVTHYTGRGYEGKAMVVSIDRFTTVKIYDKVQYYWKKQIKELESKLKKSSYGEDKDLKQKIKDMKKTDMAVVLTLSNNQNEIKKFKKQGLEIIRHRKRMKEEDLAENFKDPKNNLKIVFVCHMWMTGFDVPSLSTIYLDKPMKNHTLMQAIARANRIFEDKQAGFIIDYINVFRNLKKALAIYAQPLPGGKEDVPIHSKDQLVEELRKQIKKINKFLTNNSINYGKIQKTKGMNKIKFLEEAVSNLVIKENIKKDFLTEAGSSIKIYKAILPHKQASEFIADIEFYNELIKQIKSLDPETDISGVVHNLKEILDKSVSSKGYEIKESDKSKLIDLSKIDFEKLKKQFEKNQTGSDMERLKNVISFKLKEMIKLNSLRINYQEKFQELIDEYNRGSINQKRTFEELLKMFEELSEEEKRHVKENLSEEELALFDKLKKTKLTKEDEIKVKKVAKDLLNKLKNDGLSAVDWRKKQQIKASVKREIGIELDRLPPSYTQQDYDLKCQTAFQHVFDNYFGEGLSVYAGNY